MLNVAVTGNAASGKSTVVRWFREWGATVIDADQLVREVQAPGSPELSAIARRFGEELIRADGSLDRDALRRKVMGNPEELAALNAIVHPGVLRRREELAAAARARGERILVNEIPLLFEVLDPAAFDLVVLVDAPVVVRRERLMRQRGLTPPEADLLIASQTPAEEKRGRSHLVIENDGTLEDLERKAREAWQDIQRRAAAGTLPHRA